MTEFAPYLCQDASAILDSQARSARPLQLGINDQAYPHLTLVPSEHLDLNPADAARLGIADGQVAQIASRHGAIEAPVEVTERVSPGEVFLAFHFPETLTNALTSDVVDNIATCPNTR